RKQRALVAVPFLGDPGRDLRVLPALPADRGVEIHAIRAGVEIGAALSAGGVDGDRVVAEDHRPLLAAGGAAEDRLGRRSQAPAARPVLLLARPLETRPGALVAALRILVSPLAVLLIVAHCSLCNMVRADLYTTARTHGGDQLCSFRVSPVAPMGN